MIDPGHVLTRAGFAAGLLVLASAAASAAPALVITNLNLRQGPGTDFGIITTIPGGTTVNVITCTGEWCNVTFGGRGGYVLARNLDMGGPAPVGVVPGPVVVEQPIVVGPPVYYYGGARYWGPGYYYRGGWGGHRRW